MVKTKEVSFECRNVQVTSRDYYNVNVVIEAEPVHIDSVLDGIDNENIKTYCLEKFEPEDIFSETQLEKWAEANGYVKSNEQ